MDIDTEEYIQRIQERLEDLKKFDFTNLSQDNEKMAIYEKVKEIALNDFFDTLLIFR